MNYVGHRQIFVFGSNLAGRHGAGAALYAKKNRGAIYGQGVGIQGSSYGIPTKDFQLRPLPLHVIARYVAQFLEFAGLHPEMEFQLTAIGCGLAGYTPEHIAPMFAEAPQNVMLPGEFQ